MASDVPAFLAAAGLESFAAAFIEHGYDSVDDLRALDGEAIAELACAVGLKSGHVAKLKRALRPAAPLPAAAPAATASTDEAAHAGPTPQPPVAAAASSQNGTTPQADLQQPLVTKLFATNEFGAYKEGNIHTVYAHNGSPCIHVLQDSKYRCVICPTQAGKSDVRSQGLAHGNTLHHMGSKVHFENFRKMVTGEQPSPSEYEQWTRFNRHGTRRWENGKQAKERAASAAAKGTSRKRRPDQPLAGTPPPPPKMQPPPPPGPPPRRVRRGAASARGRSARRRDPCGSGAHQ